MKENNHTPWLEHDDILLRQLVKAGKSIRELAEHFQRSEGAIYSRIKHLGLNRTPPQSNNQATIGRPHVLNRPSPNDRKKVKGEYVDSKHGRVRIHYDTGLEISEDGKFVQKTYTDHKTGAEKRFSPDVRKDASGREYIKWSDKDVYIDEMVCTCFHGRRKPQHSIAPEHIDGDISNCNASNLKWA